MDITVITQLISTVGFPIFMVIYMLWYSNKTNARHSEEIGELRKVVEQNTLTVQRLVDKLDVFAKEDKNDTGN